MISTIQLVIHKFSLVQYQPRLPLSFQPLSHNIPNPVLIITIPFLGCEAATSIRLKRPVCQPPQLVRRCDSQPSARTRTIVPENDSPSAEQLAMIPCCKRTRWNQNGSSEEEGVGTRMFASRGCWVRLQVRAIKYAPLREEEQFRMASWVLIS